MRLTSQLIKNKEFKKGVRGYSQEEVEEFLSMIAQDYDSVTGELEALNQKVASMDESIAHYAKMEDALQTTLVLAQDAASQLKERANSESERIIREANEAARSQSDRLLREAKEAAEAAHSEAERIIAEAKAAVQDARREAETMLEKTRSESDEIIRSAEESAREIIDKAKRDVLFVIDEFDATKEEYINFRSKFKEFMMLQMDTFDEMDKAFIKHYEELQKTPEVQEEMESGDIEEAESFEDIKSFFEAEKGAASAVSEAVKEAESFEDIKDFFEKEETIEEYKRTKNS
ncbi:MAG: putative cell-division initiation protein (divIVA) [Firmicutes bacterium]|nr:putative cell-division initiation protein (divIVA) [Bacillota bacterium]